LATSPIVVGGSVFAENVFGVVFRINLRTGTILWKSSSHGVSVGPYGVAVAWGKVFAATPTGVVALDETKEARSGPRRSPKTLWRASTPNRKSSGTTSSSRRFRST
jgi:outer membrane protein assembly factor BamB